MLREDAVVIKVSDTVKVPLPAPYGGAMLLYAGTKVVDAIEMGMTVMVDGAMTAEMVVVWELMRVEIWVV